jgi:hypothetical protein
MKQRSSLLLATACAAAIRAGMLAASLALTAVCSAIIALRAPLLMPAWHGAGAAACRGGGRLGRGRRHGLAGAGAPYCASAGDAATTLVSARGRSWSGQASDASKFSCRSRLARTSDAPGARGLY